MICFQKLEPKCPCKKVTFWIAESQRIQTFIEVALGMLQTSSAVTFWVFIRVRVRVRVESQAT